MLLEKICAYAAIKPLVSPGDKIYKVFLNK